MKLYAPQWSKQHGLKVVAAYVTDDQRHLCPKCATERINSRRTVRTMETIPAALDTGCCVDCHEYGVLWPA